MYKNKNDDGTLNISGKKIKELRKKLVPKTSQRLLAEKLQLQGVDLDKNAIQKIEAGQRFVTDIELLAFADVFSVSVDQLLR
ncbi:MAG: helix-turn-helix transcriptional regulator [Bacillota bacterium]